MKQIFLLLTLLIYTYNNSIAQKQIKNFVFFELERGRIHDTSFLHNNGVVGAQLKYIWRELEPTKDHYNMELIQNDLDFLTSSGKKLFIQLQDVTFDTIYQPVPDYIIKDEQYNGGVNVQFETNNKDQILHTDGFVARRWDKSVAERFGKLLTVLGKRFDGKIEGINLPETSVDFGETGKLYPKGFTPEKYRDAILEYMATAKKAFPHSVVIQYANFMPGEWLPWNDKSYLKSLYEFASTEKIGMGGPDIKIYQKAHMNHGYKFLRDYKATITSGVAVQDGNYEEKNPMTGKQVTIKEIYDFADVYLGLDYIFWCTQEPFYNNGVLPFLKTLK